jgi:hypothetical protein
MFRLQEASPQQASRRIQVLRDQIKSTVSRTKLDLCTAASLSRATKQVKRIKADGCFGTLYSAPQLNLQLRSKSL